MSLLFVLNSHVFLLFVLKSHVFNLPVSALLVSKGYCSNLDQFISKLPKEEKFVPMGEMIQSFTNSERTYQIYKVCVFYSVNYVHDLF